MNPIGCNSDQLANLLEFCGISNVIIGNQRRLFCYENTRFKKQNSKKKKAKPTKIIDKKRKLKVKNVDPNSPFAVLQKLL